MDYSFYLCLRLLHEPFEIQNRAKRQLFLRNKAIEAGNVDEANEISEFCLFWKAQCIASVLYKSAPKESSAIMTTTMKTFRISRKQQKIAESKVGTNAIKSLNELLRTTELNQDQTDCLTFIETMIP